MALAAQRLLPIFQQSYQAWATILSNKSSLEESLEILDINKQVGSYKLNKYKTCLVFKKSIEFKNIYYQYEPNDKWALRDVNFTITKGEILGIVGETGSGKSTFVDLLMSLLFPTSGLLLIDDVAITENNNLEWMDKISHVPQDYFLTEASVAENIAFGIPLQNIDIERVKKSAERASIARDIESWADQYSTNIGERGIKLSGGQKQRIAIARALYKKAEIIIFDEATSALDAKTEMLVIDELSKTKITIVMIAHRLTTLKNCTKIIQIANGQLKSIGTYEELIKK
jgi:ATP-binding cassette subfamily B protein